MPTKHTFFIKNNLQFLDNYSDFMV